jgi:hypothetical protein
MHHPVPFGKLRRRVADATFKLERRSCSDPDARGLSAAPARSHRNQTLSLTEMPGFNFSLRRSGVPRLRGGRFLWFVEANAPRPDQPGAFFTQQAQPTTRFNP